jgi:putative DNA primase/helicase
VIEPTCCKGKDPTGKTVTCKFYDGPDGCEYQKQKHKKPAVWIFPHQMLFRENKTLDGMSVIFIDESFRDAGTSKPLRGLTFDEIEAVPPGSGELGMYRRSLARALRAQPKNGGVPRANLVAELASGDCTQAIKLEWAQKEKKPTLWPGMPTKLRTAAAKAGTNTKHIRTFDRVWRAARELIELTDPDVVSGRRASGRLFLANHKTENGVVRVVRTRGVRAIAKQYLVPTFIMDATLPSKAILEKWFPDVEVVANIEVPMPHATVRQVLGAPVAAKKLASARNLKAVHRYILREWLREGRGTAVVIMQKEPEAALQSLGLPPEIATEHFNAFTGVDIHKDVRLLIEIGRTQPGPEAVEEDAGALSGVEPVKAPITPNQSRWFNKVVRGIRLRDGTAVAVSCDLHPDSLAEDVRWQICEGGLVQGAGRARGVNRTAENPVSHHILSDVVLPITVDVVAGWVGPELEVYMVAEGIWLESPADMAAAWPDVWATPMAANNWLRANTVYFPFIEYVSKGKLHRVRYHRAGPKRKWRTAWVDPAVVPDPRAWLESRLGPLSGFELVTICFTLKADSYAHHGLDFATPTPCVPDRGRRSPGPRPRS